MTTLPPAIPAIIPRIPLKTPESFSSIRETGRAAIADRRES
jgi:hypothetical protein